ncbi:hypothetical protein RHGRI_017213 [Rhododendron griersonianum]|uniref:Uncharacterized protein n=1 Tax=Rhododendron griersonianum TaxID=479676 RepID=A0AAV6JX19_9ERIC|nr:hypothetical protein RHGRI_017213 [Rhododendron griersonianum]
MGLDFARFRFSILQNGGFGTATARVRFSPFMATLAANPTFVSDGDTIQPLLEISFWQPSGMFLLIPASFRRNQVTPAVQNSSRTSWGDELSIIVADSGCI